MVTDQGGLVGAEDIPASQGEGVLSKDAFDRILESFFVELNKKALHGEDQFVSISISR